MIIEKVFAFIGQPPNDPNNCATCATFGCGKRLSLMEQLFGNTCIDHKTKKQDQDEKKFILHRSSIDLSDNYHSVQQQRINNNVQRLENG